VRYFDATPVFVDCEPDTLNLDVVAARRTLEDLVAGRPTAGLRPPYGRVRAILPMHYGGQMVDVDGVAALARDFDLAVIEDAAHALPAFARGDGGAWRRVGTTAPITCFSFYANKCITTGEGGMVVTDDDAIAERLRVMSLHGMSKDAWKRFTSEGSWYYEIVAPGFKYNLTDVAAAIGLVQLARRDELWEERRRVAAAYSRALADVPGLVLPVERPDRRHAWHLYPVQIDPSVWPKGRAQLIADLGARGVGTSVHWMPLPLHPYYQKTYSYAPGLFPVAEAAWPRLVSLPIFPGMTETEQDHVVQTLRSLACG
jgi:perosamine synthetase